MIDLHYDLLTYIYMKLKQNDIEFIKRHCNNIYTNNVIGGIINLFFMSYKEMEEELFVSKKEIDVINIFKEVTRCIEDNCLIKNEHKFIYGIEGCDYLKCTQDLYRLYKLGLRSINPVWNEVNKFGSGIRGGTGLTKMGKDLIQTAVNLGIVIDLSHANNNTFWDIINIVEKMKKSGKKPLVIASHSNAREVRKRVYKT